jgi:hypothetical protein
MEIIRPPHGFDRPTIDVAQINSLLDEIRKRLNDINDTVASAHEFCDEAEQYIAELKAALEDKK